MTTTTDTTHANGTGQLPADSHRLQTAARHAAAMLTVLGVHVDPDTPARMVKALDELTRGRHLNPDRHLQTTFPPEAEDPALVVVNDVPFTSVCEHHVLPFTGVATVAYLPHPGQRIVGLSKLARLVQEYAARPQVQERTVHQVLDAITRRLQPRGAAAAMRATHSCMALRGARTGTGAAMTTIQYTGELATDPWRADFRHHLTGPAWT